MSVLILWEEEEEEEDITLIGLSNQGTVDAFYADYTVEEEKTFLETFLAWIPQR